MSAAFKMPEQFVHAAALAPTPAAEKQKTEKSKAKESLPWENEDPRIIRAFQLRLPADLHAALKYMGDTTAGESMHSLLLKAAFDLSAKLKKERGIK